MAINVSIFKTDREAVRDDLPLSVVHTGQSVECRRSVLSETDRAAAGGLLDEYTFSLYSVTADWESVPTVGDLVMIGSDEFRILRVVPDSVGTRFDLGAKFTAR